MAFSTDLEQMSPGQELLNAPIGELIQTIGTAIASAQLKLDEVSARVATLLGETTVPFQTPEGTVEKSLLELGFSPPFYAFTETDIEVKLNITLRVEQDIDLSGGVDVGSSGDGGGVLGSAKKLLPFGAMLNASYQRRYEVDMSGSATVKTKLVALPPPPLFIETIRQHMNNGGGTPPPPSQEPSI